MNPIATTRVDLHCHSTASEISKLGIQRSLGLPECATPPEEVYELAKRRGMDFVTITDHDTIDGCLEIADRHDVFISEELTAWFRGEPQAVHLLCFGITPRRPRVAAGALPRRRGRAPSTCTPTRSPARSRTRSTRSKRRSTPAHRRRLAAAVRGLGDPQRVSRAGAQHAGGDLHRDPRRYRRRRLRRPRRRGHRPDVHRDAARGHAGRVSAPHPGRAEPRHAASRAAPPSGRTRRWPSPPAACRPSSASPPRASRSGPSVDPAAVLRLVGAGREPGQTSPGADRGADLAPDDARALLDAWLHAIGIEPTEALIELMQADGFTHSELAPGACRSTSAGLAAASRHGESGRAASRASPPLADELAAVFAAIVPVIPYAPATTFLAGEKAKLAPPEGPRRVALIVDAIDCDAWRLPHDRADPRAAAFPATRSR